MKVLNVRRKRIKRQIVHALVKTSMLGDLDTLSLGIIPEDVLGGTREETKEDALARRSAKLGRASTWRTDPNTATKRMKLREIVLFASGEFDGRRLATTWRDGILNTEVMMESVRPELDRKVCTMKHSTKGVCDGKVSTFHRSVLVGRIGTSRLDLVDKLAEEMVDFRITIKFPSLIHKDIFIGTAR